MSYRIPVLPLLAVFVVLLFSAAAQNSSAQDSNEADASVLHDGTPVQLRLTKTLTSADVRAGDKVSLEVVQDVELQDRPVIAASAVAAATVVTCEPPKGRGHDGKLVLHLDFVTLADGETVEVRLSPSPKDAATQALLTATNFVDTHESAFKQSMHGKDMAFVQGTQFAAFINGDTPLNMARFQATSGADEYAANFTQLDITSSPDDSEINVDGAYISNTPATIGLARGYHVVTLRRAGYRSWQETFKVSGGSLKRQIRLAQDDSAGSTLSNCWGSSDCSDTLGNVAAASRAVRAAHSDTATIVK